ncbi:MAG: hypothetical protein RLP02_17125 [Coleofasciculus sp. C2-GNP5-27]
MLLGTKPILQVMRSHFLPSTQRAIAPFFWYTFIMEKCVRL